MLHLSEDPYGSTRAEPFGGTLVVNLDSSKFIKHILPHLGRGTLVVKLDSSKTLIKHIFLERLSKLSTLENFWKFGYI